MQQLKRETNEFLLFPLPIKSLSSTKAYPGNFLRHLMLLGIWKRKRF